MPATTSNTLYSSLAWIMTSGGLARPKPVGNQYVAQVILPAGGTTPVTLLTGAPGYVLTEVGIQLDDISTINVAGMISTKLTDTVFGDMFVIRWYVPSAFSAKNGPQSNRQVSGPGFFWNNKNAGSSLQCSLDTALTAGSARFFVRYALVDYVG